MYPPTNLRDYILSVLQFISAQGSVKTRNDGNGNGNGNGMEMKMEMEMEMEMGKWKWKWKLICKFEMAVASFPGLPQLFSNS